MTDWAPYPDFEAALLELLADLVDNKTAVSTPNDLEAECPFIRVTRLGGNDDRITDVARMDVDCFALLRTDANALARAAQQRMLSFPHALSSCVIDNVTTDVSPNRVPWANPDVTLFTASYRVTGRRSSS